MFEILRSVGSMVFGCKVNHAKPCTKTVTSTSYKQMYEIFNVCFFACKAYDADK